MKQQTNPAVERSCTNPHSLLNSTLGRINPPASQSAPDTERPFVTSPSLRFLDRENTLALLPVPPECLTEIDDALAKLNEGKRNGIAGSITKLVQINKRTRFNTKSWGRLQQGAVLNFAVFYKFITFEMEDTGEYVFSFNSFHHNSAQTPMLMVSLDRCSGAPPPRSSKSRRYPRSVASCGLRPTSMRSQELGGCLT